MAIPKIIGAQRDFSAGELDVSMKRADESPVMKTGARQMVNWRVLNSKAVTNRPGRTALFFETGRVEEILMAPGAIFYLAFGNGYLRVYSAAGAQLFSSTKKGDGSTTIPWTTATVKNIVYAIYQFSIYITYGDDAPVNVPQVLSWDQNVTFTLSTYAFSTFYGFQVRTPFYRASTQGIAIWPSASSGSITLTASAPLFVASQVGTRIRFCEHNQFLITAFTDSQHVTATVDSLLPQLAQISWAGPAPNGTSSGFTVGMVIRGSVSGYEGVVVALDATHIYAVQLSQGPMTATDVLTGPTGGTLSQGTITATAVAYNSVTTNGTTIWDDEVLNNYHGWPKSCFVDQNRLGFCNIPLVPSLICWSAIGVLTDQYTDDNNATANNAIQELAPGKSQVFHVLAGMESSEFVFCDNAIYYIPITPANPLIPGSVSFTQLSEYGCAPNVQPRKADQSIIYMKAGGTQVGAVQTPGAYYRPHIIDNVSDMHSHLFTASPVIAIAVPGGPAQFEETYIYMLRADGTLVVGRYAMRQGLIDVGEDGKPRIGWAPWNGAGTSTWVAAQGSDVIFTSAYPGATGLVERLDATQYLDAALPVNNLPAAIAAAQPGGKGPLWWIANGSVFLIDQGTRIMGVYQVDANGNIVPQNNDGENLSSSQLVAGQQWTATLEPFVPDASPGQSQHQRMFKRRVSRMAVYVSNSTGFLLARLFSGPLTPTSPALGTIMNKFRIPAWNQGDDPTQPPPLREEAQRWRPLGRSYDPRVAVIKDTPGPLLVHEIGFEPTI